MATQYTVTYTYSLGDSNYYRSDRVISPNDCSVSGDTDKKITKVISIEATTRLVNRGSSSQSIGWNLELAFSNTSTRVQATAPSDQRVGSGSWKTFTCSFSSSAINTINTNKWQNLQSFVSIQDTGYVKFNKNPLVITVVFESEEYFPSLSEFTGGRCDQSGTLDDEGERFAYSFHISVENTTTQTDEPTYIRLMCGNTVLNTFYDTRTGSSMSNINSWINNTSAKTGVITSIGGDVFSIGSNYLIYIEFCYHGELAQPIELLLPKARVNVHETGMRDSNGDPIGGIAFGQYSSVTTSPKFECNYPAYFYQSVSFEGGVAGLPKFAYGQAPSNIEVQHGSYYDYSINYQNVGFTSAPIVVCGFWSGSTDGNFGRCCVAAYNVTATGCVARIFNGDSSDRSPKVTWIAIGT